MIRTVITTDKNFINLPIPEQYIGKKIEVIAFALDEPAPSEDIVFSDKRKKTFDSIKLNTKGFKFNRDEANQR